MSNLEWTGLAIVALFAYAFVATVNSWRKNYIKKLDEEREKLMEERRDLASVDHNES